MGGAVASVIGGVVGSIFGGGSRPSQPAPPPPAPKPEEPKIEPPKIEDVGELAAEAELRRRARSRGRASTILTSPRATSSNSSATRTLLG